MNTADQFLARKERKAIEKRLRQGEKTKAMVPCIHEGRHGLLCSTRTRVLFGARKGLGTKVWTWSRGDLQGVAKVNERYGGVVLKTKKGRLRFDMTQRGAAQQFLESLAPPKAPVEFRTRTPKAKSRPRSSDGQSGGAGSSRPARPEPDALAHRDTAEHKARLRRMLEQGIITKREYEWQVESQH